MLAATAEKGLVATPSGRFFGFVVGGALPTALAADWLTSAWEPNAAFAALAPTEAAVEAVAARWVTDCLGLPADASVGFTTGAAMANFTCLAAARHRVLEQTGWDVEARGLQSAPMVTVLSEDRHVSVDAVLRYLGFGSDGVVPIATDNEGRIRPTALADNLRKVTGPSIVCLQAANVNTGSCDPFPRGDRGRQGTLGLGACRRRVWAVGRRKPDHPTPRRRCGRGRLVGHRRPQMAAPGGQAHHSWPGATAP